MEKEYLESLEKWRLAHNGAPFSPRAALIDMDGVLYDTMPYHAKAWRRMMLLQGIDCPEEEFFSYEGMTGPATIDHLFMREKGYTVSREEVKAMYAVKGRFFTEYGKKPLMPGADKMLAQLREAGLQRVLVTGSAQQSILDSISVDYPGAFDEGMRVTALDVVRGKPDAEPYLRGAALADAPPEECLVIENAPLGVMAGVAAGCFTIAVTTGPIPLEQFTEAGANLIFPSMPVFADMLPGLLATITNFSKS